jgi:hypothetical protein
MVLIHGTYSRRLPLSRVLATAADVSMILPALPCGTGHSGVTSLPRRKNHLDAIDEEVARSEKERICSGDFIVFKPVFHLFSSLSSTLNDSFTTPRCLAAFYLGPTAFMTSLLFASLFRTPSTTPL